MPPVEPGAEHHVAVSFAAPGEPGRYVSYWRLRGPGGRRFGHRLWVDVCVPRVPPGVADGIGAAMANVATLVGQKAKKALAHISNSYTDAQAKQYNEAMQRVAG